MFIISTSGQRARSRGERGIGVEWIAAAVERCAHYFTDINWMERRRDERGRLFLHSAKQAAAGIQAVGSGIFQMLGKIFD